MNSIKFNQINLIVKLSSSSDRNLLIAMLPNSLSSLCEPNPLDGRFFSILTPPNKVKEFKSLIEDSSSILNSEIKIMQLNTIVDI